LERIIEGTGELESAADRLAYVIREHVRVMTDTLQGSPLAFEVGAFSPERQKAIIAARDTYERAVREIIADGMVRGEFRTVDPKISAFAILGSINWIARWFDPDGALRSEELGEQFAAHLVGGLTCASLLTIGPIPTPPASSTPDTKT